MTRPKFSIVMPTRNRSHLIGHALVSALGQSAGDLEVCISDNGDDEATHAVVESHADPRIKYVRTSRVLSMPDNWDNAVGLATGEWIIVLEDDCVLSSRCLEFALQALELCPSKLVSFSWYGYYPPDYRDTSRRAQFVRAPFTGAVRYESGPQNIANAFSFRYSDIMPRPYNACTHHTLIAELKDRLGCVYPPPAPDYTFLIAVLALVDRFTFIDMPLMLSASGETPCASEQNYDEFLSELDEQKRGGYAPVHMPVVQPWSIVAESMWRMKGAMSELDGVEHDHIRYLVDLGEQLQRFEAYGFTINEEKERFRAHLATQSLGTRLRVSAHVVKRHVRHVIAHHAKPHILRSDRLRKIASAITGKEIWSGTERGFDDITGAIRALEQLYVPLTRST